MDDRALYTLIVQMVIFFVPSTLAIVRRHKDAALVTALNALLLVMPVYEFLTIKGIALVILFPTAVAWLAVLLWALFGKKRDTINITSAVPNDPPETTGRSASNPNRHLPKNIKELDKLAVKIRSSLKESDKVP